MRLWIAHDAPCGIVPSRVRRLLVPTNLILGLTGARGASCSLLEGADGQYLDSGQ